MTADTENDLLRGKLVTVFDLKRVFIDKASVARILEDGNFRLLKMTTYLLFFMNTLHGFVCPLAKRREIQSRFRTKNTVLGELSGVS